MALEEIAQGKIESKKAAEARGGEIEPKEEVLEEVEAE